MNHLSVIHAPSHNTLRGDFIRVSLHRPLHLELLRERVTVPLHGPRLLTLSSRRPAQSGCACVASHAHTLAYLRSPVPPFNIPPSRYDASAVLEAGDLEPSSQRLLDLAARATLDVSKPYALLARKSRRVDDSAARQVGSVRPIA